MRHESHEQYAFETFRGLEIADALTANGENKIWIGLGDASGHASGVWLTADEARELSWLIERIADAHDARATPGLGHGHMHSAKDLPSHDPTAFPG